MQYVFAYGTLRDPEVRKRVTGKYTTASSASVRGFKISSIKLDGIFYPIVVESDAEENQISGEYFEADDADLQALDKYESDAYRRKLVELENGIRAWIYYQ